VADMAVRDDVDRLAKTAVERLGKVDILVNNAGWNIPQAIDEIRDEDWSYCVELNLNSVMALTRALVPQMKERGWGRVIHISSIMGVGSTAKRNVYSATKTALVGMARASALDVGRFGITVNCIAPGPIATEMPMSILSKQQQDAFSARTAIGRWGTPDEIAGPALLLASDAGSYITGTVLVVDGGVTANVF
jgi:NAD(P)-dependent dehydrogenase (short-subunit alcohol dehydrogenase family)